MCTYVNPKVDQVWEKKIKKIFASSLACVVYKDES